MNVLDQIVYDGVRYSELDIDNPQRMQIEKLAARLEKIEEDVLHWPEGIIYVQSQGGVLTTGFPRGLGQKIAVLLFQ
jgi:hypothetical protein